MPALPRTLHPHALRLTAASLVLAAAAVASFDAAAAPWGHRQPGGPMQLEQWLAGTDVSAEQRAQLKSIMDAARNDLRAENDAERASRQQMVQLLAAPVVDPAAVEDLRQQMLARHDARSKRMTQALLEAGAVLSPEQRWAIAEKLVRAPRQSDGPQRLPRGPAN